jgi:hypothetical protein
VVNLTFAAGSILIDGNATPQAMFENFVAGVRQGVGSSRWRLETVR